MRIASEKPLIRDACKRLSTLRDRTIFLYFDQLVDSALPGAIRHDAAGKLVDDLHFSVDDDVLHVTLIDVKRAQCLLDEVLARFPDCPRFLESRHQFSDPMLALPCKANHLFACQQMEI